MKSAEDLFCKGWRMPTPYGAEAELQGAGQNDLMDTVWKKYRESLPEHRCQIYGCRQQGNLIKKVSVAISSYDKQHCTLVKEKGNNSDRIIKGKYAENLELLCYI